MRSGKVSVRSQVFGAVFVSSAVLFQALWLGLPAALLSVALVVSFIVWISTSWQVTTALRKVYVLGLLVFVCHAAEELGSGFHQALPLLLGYQPWSALQFLLFNGVWGLIFFGAAFVLMPERNFSVLIVLFFTIAGGLGNGVFHLLLVVGRGAYFPGAWTAPFCLATGIGLLRLLYQRDTNVSPGRDAAPRSVNPTS